ncbi:MAG: hypothetical protein IIB40_08230 [Candidatus Marinimicrobia bacterium]|nr:hypothetical protein [Candidatus Neomarinimicrobiota bacterium]MCH7955208.1 hypothetical protein [Candidatus Neomarinimicrobiota bacterium]
MKRLLYIIISTAIVVTHSTAIGQTRVGFSTFGNMINIPTSSHLIGPDFLKFGFGVELNNFAPFQSSQGIYFDFEPSSKYRFGITALNRFAPEADTSAGAAPSVDPPPEFGISFQRNIFTYENMSVAAGVTNIIFTESLVDNQTILSSQVGDFSYYGIVSREQEFELYRLRWYVGVGTDRFAASRNSLSAQTSQIGIFVGFDLKTAFLPQIGGLRILGEFDGQGMNIGTRLPLTRDYTVNLAIMQVEKILSFGETTNKKFPGIALGLSINFPRKIPEEILERPIGLPAAGRVNLPPGVMGEPGLLVPSGYLSPEEVQSLRDSINFAGKQIETLNDLASMLRQRVNVLQDSVQIVKTDRFALEQNINSALKHLSRSLRYFYSARYRSALEEVETAIEFNPNLALAYARRGSIFYKLGDTERAVMNWNVALQLDPEYDDIRNILRAMGENRLRVTSFRN